MTVWRSRYGLVVSNVASWNASFQTKRGGKMSDNSAPGERDYPQLTGPARGAIRYYMLRLVVIPAGLLTLISGAGGFFLNKFAFQEGYDEAYKAAIKDIVSTAQQVGAAKASADEALNNMRISINGGVASINSAVEVAEKASQAANAVSQRASDKLTTDTTKLAQALAQTETFQRATDNIVLPGFETLSKTVKDLDARMTALTTSLASQPVYSITQEIIDLKGLPNPDCREMPPPAGVGKYMQCKLPAPSAAPGMILGAVMGRSLGCNGCSFEIGTITDYGDGGGSMYVYRPGINAGERNQPWEWKFELLVVRSLPPIK